MADEINESSDDSAPVRFGYRAAGTDPHNRGALQASPRRAHSLLRSSIRSGVLDRHQHLVEDALVRSMATSRNAVRLALRMLAKEGLVQRRTNLGTDVIRSVVQIPVPELLPTSPEADGAARAAGWTHRMSIRQLEYGIVPASELLKQRLDQEAESVFMRELLVLFDDEPAAVIVGYYPLDFAPRMLADRIVDFTNRPSDLAHMLQTLYGRTLGTVDVNVEAVACDERTARALKIDDGAPLLVRETVVRDSTGRPCMLDYSHWRGDRISLQLTMPPTGVRLRPVDPA